MTNDERPFGRLARTCPRCGAREPTLGTRCASCGRFFEPRSWSDSAPDFDAPIAHPAGIVAGAFVALANLMTAIVLGTLSALGKALAAARRRR